MSWETLVGSDLRLLIGFYRLIDRLHPLKELRHRRQQLLLEQGDLFLSIGVIHPGPGDQQPPGGVGGQEHLHRPVAALNEDHRILSTTQAFRAEYDELTPSGAATGRLQTLGELG